MRSVRENGKLVVTGTSMPTETGMAFNKWIYKLKREREKGMRIRITVTCCSLDHGCNESAICIYFCNFTFAEFVMSDSS